MVPNRPLCSLTDNSPVSSTEANLRNTLVPLARQHFGDNYRYQDDNATPISARVVPDFLQ